MKSLLFKLLIIMKRCINLILSIPGIIKIVSAKSVYTHLQRKKFVKRLSDNIIWYIKYNEKCTLYNLYGCDIAGVNFRDFMDYRSFYNQRNLNNRVGYPNSQIGILRDKFLFFKYMSSYGFCTPKVFAMIKDGIIYDENLNVINENNLICKEDYFIKEIDGECASFVRYI